MIKSTSVKINTLVADDCKKGVSKIHKFEDHRGEKNRKLEGINTKLFIFKFYFIPSL